MTFNHNDAMSPAVDPLTVTSFPPLRFAPPAGEAAVLVEFTETCLPYQFGETARFPEDEGHRLAGWLGVCRALDFKADAKRGHAEQRRRLAGQ